MVADYIPKEDLESNNTNFLLVLISFIAPYTSIGMMLSPIPTIRQIVQDGTVNDLPLLPYTSMVTSTFVWIIYGIIKSQPIIYITNLIEFILSIYYFVEFTNYAPSSSTTFPGSVYTHIYFTIGVWFFTIFVTMFSSNRILILGDLTAMLTILTLASPLAAVQAVLQSKSSESIPWPFTIAALFNCIIWTIVGSIELHDVYVYFPEVLGLIFGSIQVLLKLIYHHQKQRDLTIATPTTGRRATPYVEMPYPVLERVRQIVMMGNNNNYTTSSNSTSSAAAVGVGGGTYSAVQLQDDTYDLALLEETIMIPTNNNNNDNNNNTEYVVEFNSVVSSSAADDHHHDIQQQSAAGGLSSSSILFQQQQPTSSLFNEPQLGGGGGGSGGPTSSSSMMTTTMIPPCPPPPPPTPVPVPLSDLHIRSRSGNTTAATAAAAAATTTTTALNTTHIKE